MSGCCDSVLLMEDVCVCVCVCVCVRMCMRVFVYVCFQRQLERRIKVIAEAYAKERDKANTGTVSYEVFKECVLEHRLIGCCCASEKLRWNLTSRLPSSVD